MYLISNTICRKNNKDKDKKINALIDLGSEVDAIHLAYARKLGFQARKIDVSAQKIDRSHLDIFEMVIADYSIND